MSRSRWIRAPTARAYMTVEVTTTDPRTGQPAFDAREAMVKLAEPGRRLGDYGCGGGGDAAASLKATTRQVLPAFVTRRAAS